MTRGDRDRRGRRIPDRDMPVDHPARGENASHRENGSSACRTSKTIHAILIRRYSLAQTSGGPERISELNLRDTQVVDADDAVGIEV